jgi:hypothetical protein
MCAPLLREACLDVERAAKAQELEQAAVAFPVMETAMVDVLTAMARQLAANGLGGE